MPCGERRKHCVSPQISQTSHPKHPQITSIHTDTHHFRQSQKNPAKQTGITKQTPIQTWNQKTAHKHPIKTPNKTQHTLCQNNPKITPEQQKTDRTAEISRRKKYVNEKNSRWGVTMRICACAHNFSPFRK